MIAEPNNSLESMIASRVATEAVRLAEEIVRDAINPRALDPDALYGFMTSEEAASFLGIPYSSFREIATSLPRYALTPKRFGYLRKDLIAYGKERKIGDFGEPLG